MGSSRRFHTVDPSFLSLGGTAHLRRAVSMEDSRAFSHADKRSNEFLKCFQFGTLLTHGSDDLSAEDRLFLR
jgi:hypothetical protein